MLQVLDRYVEALQIPERIPFFVPSSLYDEACREIPGFERDPTFVRMQFLPPSLAPMEVGWWDGIRLVHSQAVMPRLPPDGIRVVMAHVATPWLLPDGLPPGVHRSLYSRMNKVTRKTLAKLIYVFHNSVKPESHGSI